MFLVPNIDRPEYSWKIVRWTLKHQSINQPNIDQMYKEMKKFCQYRNSQASIIEVRNKHGNGDEFPDFADLFIFWHKKC